MAFVFVALVGKPALALDTYKRWDGSQNINAFGCVYTPTYGEIITVPASKSLLKKFTFTWQNYNNGGSMVVRAEVYAWDGKEATGNSLYESAPRTISFKDNLFHKESFSPGISVTPGTRYVLFASIDKDYDKCKQNYALDWGSVDDVHPDSEGHFVYLNDGGDDGEWTTVPWSHWDDPAIDLAFRAGFIR
jgi:hypothetical protein